MFVEDIQKARRRDVQGAMRPLLPPGLGLQEGLLRGRVHELCGPARHVLAALLMQADPAPQAPVLWIAPKWLAESFHPEGLAAFSDPGRMIFAGASQAQDLLWAMEEALRSGAVPLVIADLTEIPGLTPVRRLHLAAEAGMARRGGVADAPLGLLLTPGDGGAAGVESRWRMAPHPGGWRLSRERARMAPPKDWILPLPTPERAPHPLKGGQGSIEARLA